MDTSKDKYQRINFSLLVVSLVALFTSGCESIDKGLYEAANATSQQNLITGQRELSLHNRQQQIAEGNRAAEQLIQKLRQNGIRMNEDLDPKAYNAAVQIFRRVHSVSHLRNEKWTVIVYDDPSFNAFVTGGTYVFIHKGLMDQMKSSDELAAVLGHELTHVVSNHAFQGKDQRALVGLTGSNTSKRSSFAAAFTYEQEAEADRIGILYCALAGFDPYAAYRVWSRLAAQQGDTRMVGFYQDHPVNSERAANTKSVAAAVAQYYKRRQINPAFEEILANNTLVQKRTGEEVKPGAGGGFLAALEVAANTMLTQKKAKNEEARQTQLNQMVESVRSNTFFLKWQKVGSKTLRLTFRYQGPLQVKNIQFLCTFSVDGVNTQTVVCNTGMITAQGDYNSDISDERFAIRGLRTPPPPSVTSAEF